MTDNLWFCVFAQIASAQLIMFGLCSFRTQYPEKFVNRSMRLCTDTQRLTYSLNGMPKSHIQYISYQLMTSRISPWGPSMLRNNRFNISWFSHKHYILSTLWIYFTNLWNVRFVSLFYSDMHSLIISVNEIQNHTLYFVYTHIINVPLILCFPLDCKVE